MSEITQRYRGNARGGELVYRTGCTKRSRVACPAQFFKLTSESVSCNYLITLEQIYLERVGQHSELVPRFRAHHKISISRPPNYFAHIVKMIAYSKDYTSVCEASFELADDIMTLPF
ncbi:hypothetical protein RRG08_031745 [Elysia crispata]|uniref:Uncharacterized protein n=1 Tax=Elysia crispata TaxID=231223 RepID=A0AAE1DF49_9GAST|nr:hypothetical protein RRG08_031745 [Elysia crispata]